MNFSTINQLYYVNFTYQSKYMPKDAKHSSSSTSGGLLDEFESASIVASLIRASDFSLE